MPGRGSQPSPAEGLRAATGSKYWSIQEEGPAPSHSSALGRLPCRKNKPACAPPGSPVRKGAPERRPSRQGGVCLAGPCCTSAPQSWCRLKRLLQEGFPLGRGAPCGAGESGTRRRRAHCTGQSRVLAGLEELHLSLWADSRASRLPLVAESLRREGPPAPSAPCPTWAHSGPW